MKIPIAVFTYNRPNHTERLLDSLSCCTRLDECEITIFCDGVKKPEHTADVEALRKVVRRWSNRLGATVTERTENLGLARSIVSGTTELCNRHGRVIVVEDDLVLGVDFVNFMLRGLDRYENEPSVFQVSGHSLPVAHPFTGDAYFLPYITTWGWATWKRAWQTFNWNPPDAAEYLREANFRYRFDLGGSYPFSAMLTKRLAGRNDSWGILWYYAVFGQRGLGLFPRQTLVQNTGFDGTGTHTAPSRQSALGETAPAQMPEPIHFPVTIEVDQAAFKQVKRFLRGLQTRPKSRAHRVLGRILHRLRK